MTNKIKTSEKFYRFAIILKNQKHIFKPKGKISHKNIRGGKNNKISYNQTVELSNVKIDIYGGNNTKFINEFNLKSITAKWIALLEDTTT